MPLLKLVKSKNETLPNKQKKLLQYHSFTNIQFSGTQMKVIAVSSVEAGEEINDIC